MRFAILINGKPERIDKYNTIFDADGTQYPRGLLFYLTPSEREKLNVYPLHLFAGPIPKGQKVSSKFLEFDNDLKIIVEKVIFENINESSDVSIKTF